MGTSDSHGHTPNVRLKMRYTVEYYAAIKNYTMKLVTV